MFSRFANTRLVSLAQTSDHATRTFFRKQIISKLSWSVVLSCWGVLGIPLLETVYWFQSFYFWIVLVSWFQRFWVSRFQNMSASLFQSLLVSKLFGLLFQRFLVFSFLGCKTCFKVSWFLGFKISKFQRFNDPILPNSHFMSFDRHRSHIQDFQDCIRRIFVIFRRPSVPTFSKLPISNILRFIKII